MEEVKDNLAGFGHDGGATWSGVAVELGEVSVAEKLTRGRKTLNSDEAEGEQEIRGKKVASSRTVLRVY